MLVIIISYNQDFFKQFVFLLTEITSNSFFRLTRITGMGNPFLLNATFPSGFFWRQFFFTFLILFSYSKQLFLVEMITLSCEIILVYVHVNYDQDFYTWTVLKLIYPGYGSLQHWVKKDWSRIIFGDIFLLLSCHSFLFLSRDDNFSEENWICKI